MKYIVMIHANPQPWGHPVEDHLPEYQAMSDAERQSYLDRFENLLVELDANGELVGGEALGSPADATIYRWDQGNATQNAGPYAETKEHLAGFFIVEVKDAARAEAIGTRFAAPGQSIELRPLGTTQED